MLFYKWLFLTCLLKSVGNGQNNVFQLGGIFLLFFFFFKLSCLYDGFFKKPKVNFLLLITSFGLFITELLRDFTHLFQCAAPHRLLHCFSILIGLIYPINKPTFSYLIK